MRGALQHFIEARTPYKVCDAIGYGVSVIHKATEARCNLILLHLRMPLQDGLVTVSLLRSKLPLVKIVGVSASSVDLDANSPRSGIENAHSQSGVPHRMTKHCSFLIFPSGALD